MFAEAELVVLRRRLAVERRGAADAAAEARRVTEARVAARMTSLEGAAAAQRELYVVAAATVAEAAL